MSDFREPKREMFDEQIEAARADLIDWMFRRHSSGDHLVPLKEFLQIVGYIEKRSIVWKSLEETMEESEALTEISVSDDEKNERKSDVARYRAMIALMCQIRAHYSIEDFAAESQVRLVESKD